MSTEIVSFAGVDNGVQTRVHDAAFHVADTTGYLGTPTASAEVLFPLRGMILNEADLSNDELGLSGERHKERFAALLRAAVPADRASKRK
jgi:hypothetical protein